MTRDIIETVRTKTGSHQILKLELVIGHGIVAERTRSFTNVNVAEQCAESKRRF